ncbi:MAG: PAS domain-containing protein, partial [Myxococcota bacterium]|nr:PAS domain-containing protein [Myxococcota bacterium]
MIWQRMLIVLALAVAVVLTALVAGIRRRDSVNRAFMLTTSVVSISLALQTLLMIPCYLGLEEPFLRVQAGLFSLCSLCFLLLSLAVARCPFDGVSRLLSWSTAVVALLQVFADLAYVGFEGQGADAVPLIETKLSLVMMLVTAANLAYGVWLMEGRRRRVPNAADKSILIIVEAGFVVALVMLVALMIVFHWLRPGVFPVALEGPAFCLALIVVYQGVWRHSMLDLTVRSAAGSLFECATDGIVLLDTEERVSRINPAGLRLFWMDEGVPNDGALDEALRRLLPEPEAHERLVTFASSGQVRHMLASKTRYVEQGMSLGFVLVLSDATAIVEAQTRLRSFHDGLAREVERRAEQLAEAQRLAAVGGLARNVAHVLNNQLAVVIGMTESALDRCEPDTSLHSDLCDVLDAAVNARDVIAQIGPDGHGNGDLASATSLRRVLKEVHKTLSAGLPRNIKVRFAYDEDHHVLGNATQLLQVFVNLGKNARDA